MITHAPQIETLATLAHAWRHVASKQGTQWIWHGDLADAGQREIYRIMREEHATLVQISRRLMIESELLFAKIGQNIDATKAYDAAYRFREEARGRSAMAKLIHDNARRRIHA